ncbi:tRNA (adenosine(37)-N6)-threonylcarbamoyltransferase complex transferase subunit TsaD [Candidatus Parcubacteria bacterium]|nr:tRNA (adenosine(37)-N6)-threonylcarbamoyltransferase complex transferase subunit TsaD [Candidatus Parcubacteria bacterium]
MKVLGIETSCDETAVAVLEIEDINNVKVLSNIVSSQVKLHAPYGGVVPNLAAREHTKNIAHVFEQALTTAGISDFEKEIDLITVTSGPGLGPALLVGITFAKTIAWKYNKPLIGTNHLKGHVYSNWLNEDFNAGSVVFPILNLVVSGGHTELVLMKNYEDFELVGETMDDAAGEAFDKVARLLGLGYPGGPAISKIAESGNRERFPLPRPMLHSKNFNFSYSGLKTAVLYLLRDLKEQGAEIDDQTKADIAASFQEAAIDVLVKKTIQAAKEYQAAAVFLSGGVSASAVLREKLKSATEDIGLRYSRPPMAYTTDNATMIAIAGYINHKYEKTDGSWQSVHMNANLGFKVVQGS